MAVISRIYKQPERAYLFDVVIQSLQDALGGISWLNHIFGRSERLVQMREGKKLYTPNVYYGKDEYISLLPDNTALGNYCFFVMQEPQLVTMPMGTQNRVKTPFSLIVWLDMRTIGRNKDDRNTEYVKELILRTIRKAWKKKGSVTIERIYERAENVFQGFTMDEIDNQFLMSPYTGFRFTGEMTTDEECEIQ